MISDHASALRLARAILDDVTLYGGGETALDDAAKMAEARALFVSRVDVSLSAVLDEERNARRGAQPLSQGAMGHPRVDRGEGSSGLGSVMPIAIAIFAAVVALLAALAFVVAQ